MLGIPYNFEPPKLRRLLSAYWQPGEGMLVEKLFGVGFTLNLASWRSWVVIGVAGAMVWQERSSKAEKGRRASEEEPVEVVVED